MGSDTTVAYTSPATNVKVYRETTGSADVQYIRRHTSTTMTVDAWAVTIAGVASRVTGDEARTSLTFSNRSSALVWIRPDSTIPTSATAYIELQAGDVYDVEDGLVELAWSVAAAVGTAGNLMIWKGTAP